MDFEIPDDVTALDDEALAQALDGARTTFAGHCAQNGHFGCHPARTWHGAPCTSERSLRRHHNGGAELVTERGVRAMSVAAETSRLAPWGIDRMKPFPRAAVLPAARAVLDAETQTAQWVQPDGSSEPLMDKHKRSETPSETSTKTSLDGTPDQGSDQSGDSD
ncbi:putative ATP-grasp-modified RiPP [Streptomyces sp. NPDC096205]|uniref:putative ATP-grasp-modified RiPP n=1 Tax=Streptomyces sp. NPDC096205 TaxID=3366081 RepID=UPI00382D5A39